MIEDGSEVVGVLLGVVPMLWSIRLSVSASVDGQY